MNDHTSINYQWYIGSERPNSDLGKSILALSHAGVGYFILNRDRNKTDDVIYAFRRPTCSVAPNHLSLATEDQDKKLEKMYAERQ